MTYFEWRPEEREIYGLAKWWRDDAYRPDLQEVDWLRFANLIYANRMAVLADQFFRQHNVDVPAAAQQVLDEQIKKNRRAAALFRGPLTTYLNSAATRGIKTLVLKGLWLCENIYHNSALRPGADIDLLVPRSQVGACLDLLKEQGIGEYWPNLLREEYFYRHHLHQQRSSPDLQVWFEIHWAVDHPYTLLTIDYGGIFRRAQQGELWGAPAEEMAPEDLLLTLAIHVVKHAVYLPSLVEQPDLPRIILADNMLLAYLDVAEVIKQVGAGIDWDMTTVLARAWGATEILRSVLQVCAGYLDAPVPTQALSARPARRPFAFTKRLMKGAAEQKLDAYDFRPPNPFWRVLMASNGAFILRPIRLLEQLTYFFPPADFLERRYGGTTPWVRTRHLALAIWQSARFSVDAVYFALDRYVRLKRMGKSASLFQRLDSDI